MHDDDATIVPRAFPAPVFRKDLAQIACRNLLLGRRRLKGNAAAMPTEAADRL
ncbi:MULTISPECIES: hypothetical protein [Caballeronia]|uniref:Uncharacterized protein n=2 Tax=Caballeronia TaxID=1827195 RepID=A0AA37IC68_9BURK|nr:MULTISPECIES: hypothetical protein [Caballeronia]GJH26539.1 hypothetical protein CBA19CS42_18505 [Caballeronia novacaledonica]